MAARASELALARHRAGLHGGTLWAAVTNAGRIEVWRLPDEPDGAAARKGQLAGAHSGAAVGITIAAGTLVSAAVSRDGARTLVARRPPCVL